MPLKSCLLKLPIVTVVAVYREKEAPTSIIFRYDNLRIDYQFL